MLRKKKNEKKDNLDLVSNFIFKAKRCLESYEENDNREYYFLAMDYIEAAIKLLSMEES